MSYSPFTVLVFLAQCTLVCSYVKTSTVLIDTEGQTHTRQDSLEVAQMMRREQPATEGAAIASSHLGATAGGSQSEPVNFVINCPGDVNRLARFRKHMHRVGLSFEVFPCVKLTKELLKASIHERLLGYLAERGDLKYAGVLGVALAHIKLLNLIVARNISAANIFEDDEVVYDSYHADRQQVLGSLPNDFDFVNLNPHIPRGDAVNGTDLKLVKMVKGIPRWSNIWLSNYFVSQHGAKKLLNFMRSFDLGPSGDQQIDWFVVELFASGCCQLEGYAYETDKLSKHCHQASTKELLNKKGLSLLAEDPVDPPVDPICLEDDLPC